MTFTKTDSRVLGIDIGGANLKYATLDGRALDRFFPMWTRFDELGDQLASDIATEFPEFDTFAITMTGELADCFASRAAGVRHIVDQVRRGLPNAAQEKIRFYATDGRFHDADAAVADWESFAASNWHALARCVGRRVAADALLIDVGSTTTDVIAIHQGEILTAAKTDFERLRDDALVYVGCRRTPVCGLVDVLRLRGDRVPVMNEVFATIDDARLLLGLQDEDSSDCQTADTHPRDRHHARTRVARMIGLDHDQISEGESLDLARQIHAAAGSRISSAVQNQWQRLQTRRVGDRTLSVSNASSVSDKSHDSDQSGDSPVCVLSGHGQDLVVLPTGANPIDLRSTLSGGISRGAPAWAVAVLSEGDCPPHLVQSQLRG